MNTGPDAERKSAWLSPGDPRREPPREGIVHGVCPHDCPDCCSLLSLVRGGRLISIAGDPSHPVTRGFLCRKFARAPERVYASDRLRYPMIRTGKKGDGRFRRSTWREALAIIAGRWREILTSRGGEGILPFFGSGTEGLVNGRIAGRRFFNRLGSLQLQRTICTKNGRDGFRYTMGSSMGADARAVANNRLIIEWGANTVSTSIHHHALVAEARHRGARHVIVNPVRGRGSDTADLVLQPIPGTDAALALGVMQILISGGWYDADFVERYTIGFDRLVERVRQYPLDRVAALTGIAAADIRQFADLYASCRPSMIYVGPGCQRHTNGAMTLRALSCLPALVGAWRDRGAGLYYPTSTIFPLDLSRLEGEALRPAPPQSYNMIDLGRLLDGKDMGIRSLFVFNGNPAVTLFNQNRLRRGLAREDLFMVVHDLYLTDTARFADVLLPACTSFEYADLFVSYYHFGVLLNRPAIKPVAQCRSNLETFAALAGAMGFRDACFGQDAWQIIEQILALDEPALRGLTLERLIGEGWCPSTLSGAHAFVDAGRFPTATGRIEFYSADMERAGLDPLPAYVPPQESRDATPELARKFPLYFLTPAARAALNSNYAQHARNKHGNHGPELLIHPDDAGARKIHAGDSVRVFNHRGACHLRAEVTAAVRPGVVASHGLAWDHQYPGDSNANHTTPDFTGDIGGGSAFNSNLVEVERSTVKEPRNV